MNLPNKLTIIRILMVPVFVLFLLTELGGRFNNLITLVLFVTASLTDLLDGYLARKNNLVTNFGKFMDPPADKLLVCSALICFVATKQLPAWMVIVIIAREFIISGFRLIASDEGVVIAASYWGKVKTTVQIIMIIALIIEFPYALIIAWIAVILTVVSLVDYIVKNIQVIKKGGM